MDNTTKTPELATVPCTFPGHDHAVPVGQAKVPGFKAIRALTKRPVTLEDLRDNAVCPRAARMAGHQVVMYWYESSARMLAEREVESQAAKSFFGRYRIPSKSARGNGKAPVTPFDPGLPRGQRQQDA